MLISISGVYLVLKNISNMCKKNGKYYSRDELDTRAILNRQITLMVLISSDIYFVKYFTLSSNIRYNHLSFMPT
jgi:hypothetical protein